MNELSRGVRIWAELFFILLQSMRLSDGRTDRQTAFSWLYRALHYMQSHANNREIHGQFTALIYGYIAFIQYWSGRPFEIQSVMFNCFNIRNLSISTQKCAAQCGHFRTSIDRTFLRVIRRHIATRAKQNTIVCTYVSQRVFRTFL